MFKGTGGREAERRFELADHVKVTGAFEGVKPSSRYKLH